MIKISPDMLKHVIGGAHTTAAMSSQALSEASQPVAGKEIPGTGGQIFRGGGSTNAWRHPGM
jgi:hypothetical protein